MKSILFLLCATLAAIVNIPSCIYWRFQGKADKKGAYARGQRIVDVWVPRLERLGGIILHKEGEENITDRTALWVGNHQGDMDILLIMKELGKLYSIVSKKETRKVPVVAQWMANVDCIFIDRGNPRQTLESINRAQELLESGRSVVIFPEGTRSKGPEMNEFKSGALRCAVKAGVPIVPFAIDGTYKCFEAQGYIKDADVRMSVLPAVEPEDFKDMNTRQLSCKVQQLIQDELYRMRGGAGGERKIWTEVPKGPQNS